MERVQIRLRKFPAFQALVLLGTALSLTLLVTTGLGMASPPGEGGAPATNVQGPMWGACCRFDGSCFIAIATPALTAQEICEFEQAGNTYQGDNVRCARIICPPPTWGACCRFDGTCFTAVATPALTAKDV